LSTASRQNLRPTQSPIQWVSRDRSLGVKRPGLVADNVHRSSSQSVTVPTSCCVVTASNGGRSPYSGFPNYQRVSATSSNSNSSQRLNCSRSLTAHSLQSAVPNSLCSPGTDDTENTVLLLLWPLHSNGRCSQSHHLATGLHATIYFDIYMFTIPTVSLTPKMKA
jgi:hypothetical protein